MSALPSRTSVLVAAARAVGSRLDHPDLRNPDHLAIKLMGPEERAVILGDPVAEALEQDTPDLWANPRVMGIVTTMIVRTKFIDEHLGEAIAGGATQVVIMGAGWDTRAYRLTELLRGVHVFEVDRPALQEWKRRRAEEELGPTPANLTYLPIEFQTQKLADVMAQSGYDSSQKTFFLWEGVTMYLPEEAVRETLSWIARQAPGSSLVLDFADKEVVDFMTRVDQGYQPSTEVGQIAAERGKQLARWGEPWIFGLHTETAGEWVAALGFEHRETLVMASAEAAQRYLGWQEDTQFPAPVRRLYSIMEAVVAPG